MPICSYIIHTKENQLLNVSKKLEVKKECSVYLDKEEEHDVLVLVTDTSCEKSEEALRKDIEAIEDIQCMALTFANFEEEIYGKA